MMTQITNVYKRTRLTTKITPKSQYKLMKIRIENIKTFRDDRQFFTSIDTNKRHFGVDTNLLIAFYVKN